MKVFLYGGGERLVHKSGVGRAMSHQKAALTEAGVSYTQNITDDFDVVHLNTILPDSLIVASLAKLSGHKVVYHGHSTQEDFRNSFTGTNLAAPVFKQWLRICYNTADAVVAPTPYARDLLKGYDLHPPVYSVSNGVDTSYYTKDPEGAKRFRTKFGIAADAKVVISVGLCIERKGISDFIALARALPQYEFYWFGEAGPLVPAHVHQLMAGASENCHFPGFIETAGLKDAYSGADLFLFLTHEETEGIVLLEALSMCTPVLVRDIPIYKTWLRDGQDVYKASDFEGFKRKTTEMLEGKLPNITAAGRLVAEMRDMPHTGQALKAVYEDVFKS